MLIDLRQLSLLQKLDIVIDSDEDGKMYSKYDTLISYIMYSTCSDHELVKDNTW